MSARSLIKGFAHRFGFDIIRYVEESERPFAVLPLVVREHLARTNRFFFVQIGAGDGVRADPLRELVLEHHLAGLLVEPVPEQFAKLRQNYADQPQLRFENCAVATRDGERALYWIPEGTPLPDWVVVLASFDRGHLLHHGIENIDEYIEEIDVRTLTLSSLFAKHHVDDVTLLQVDAEGYDYEIVKMAMQAGLRPAIINYEHVHLVPHIRAACKELLVEHGYRFVDVGIDTLAVEIGEL